MIIYVPLQKLVCPLFLLENKRHILWMDAVCVLVAAHAYTHAEGAGSYLSVSGGVTQDRGASVWDVCLRQRRKSTVRSPDQNIWCSRRPC